MVLGFQVEEGAFCVGGGAVSRPPSEVTQTPTFGVIDSWVLKHDSSGSFLVKSAYLVPKGAKVVLEANILFSRVWKFWACSPRNYFRIGFQPNKTSFVLNNIFVLFSMYIGIFFKKNEHYIKIKN
jgi:hypothetical protein